MKKPPTPATSAYLPLSYQGEKRFFHPSDHFWKGFGLGVLLFALFLAILLFSGDLSASKFIYVDF
jgi:hypothetical protein